MQQKRQSSRNGLEAPLEQPISQEWIVMKTEEVYSSALDGDENLEKRQHDHEKATNEK